MTWAFFFYQNFAFGSNHTGILNLGYDNDSLSIIDIKDPDYLPHMLKEIGYGQGRYVSIVFELFKKIAPHLAIKKSFQYDIDKTDLTYSDKKSNKFFDSIFNGTGSPTLNLSLFFLSVNLNFLNHILSKILVRSTYTEFKVRYIALHHTVRSLRKMQNHFYRSGILTDRSKKFLSQILSDKELKEITSQKKFRNIIVHYDLQDLAVTELSWDLPYFGIVEYFFPESSFLEYSIRIDHQLVRIANVYSEWMDWEPNAYELNSW